VPGDALAEGAFHPRGEVVTAVAAGRVDQPGEALVGVLGAEIPEVVLEGVGDPAPVHSNVRRALVLVDLVAERLVEEPVELAVVAEDDVAALVPGEACRVDLGARVPAGHR
jgi:hypothetical protein